jgi:hypothetical protein
MQRKAFPALLEAKQIVVFAYVCEIASSHEKS